jgi:hypothetical protein
MVSRRGDDGVDRFTEEGRGGREKGTDVEEERIDVSPSLVVAQ